MKRLFFFFLSFVTLCDAKATDYNETLSVISDGYANIVQDAQVIRKINGGSVLIPEFDDSCPPEFYAPFSYACKIVEEYMPPCLPLKVQVSCNSLIGSQANAISLVSGLCLSNFGVDHRFSYIQMSAVKGIILAELGYNSAHTFLDSVPDSNFFTDLPDIKICYNEKRINELSFSLDPDPGENYDFISIVIRDLLRGLGLTSSFRYNRVAGTLDNPSRGLTPFESCISIALGIQNSPEERLAAATKGELLVGDKWYRTLKLYAPSVWENGSSLNSFIPQEDCCITNILSKDFCKGMVTRSLSDDNSSFIFRTLLGWEPNFTTSTGIVSTSASGSTSLVMPYNGSLSFNDNLSDIFSVIERKAESANIQSNIPNLPENVGNYIQSFVAFQDNGQSTSDFGTSISILKRDGTWDLVKFINGISPDLTYSMSDWELHYGESEYARTIDGYLRARITFKSRDKYNNIEYKSIFFVVDYLPQKVGLRYSYIESQSEYIQLASSPKKVRIYFSNTEGVKRIILEKLRYGARVPSKIEVEDFKKGYYETTVSGITTFTAIGYNDNGATRGIPLQVTPTISLAEMQFDLKNDCINILADKPSIDGYDYTITSLSDVNIKPMTGFTNGVIDISSLSSGIFGLSVYDRNTGALSSFKFKK